jgi:lysine/arginine/ornithine transport system substrate-binding protein
MKKTCFALSAALLVASFAASAAEIRFGVDASYPPFEFKAQNGQVAGFDIELGNEICKRLHAQCVWVENDFDGMIPALKAKKFDGILSSMSMTEQRMKEIAFSDKLFNTPTRMVAKTGSGIKPTAASLAGKRVGVEQGTIQETYAKTYWAPKGVEVVSYKDQNQVQSDLAAGRLDAALQDAVEASEGFLKKPEGKGYGFVGANLVDVKTLGSGAGIGLRKEDVALKTRINKAIASMIKDGTYAKIEKKYFAFDVYN